MSLCTYLHALRTCLPTHLPTYTYLFTLLTYLPTHHTLLNKIHIYLCYLHTYLKQLVSQSTYLPTYLSTYLIISTISLHTLTTYLITYLTTYLPIPTSLYSYILKEKYKLNLSTYLNFKKVFFTNHLKCYTLLCILRNRYLKDLF
jgi:hypothetical protein